MVDELPKSVSEKYKKLQTAIRSKEKLIVAFSGGVDSALLAKVAYDELGNSAWAVLVDSESVPEFELSEAKSVAKELGINFHVLNSEQLSDEKFVENTTNRCYFCRKSMASRLLNFANEKGIKTIAAGAQATDLDDFRPGIKAFQESSIWHPFIELEFSKLEIRQLAESLKLPVAKKPAMACLASRVPYGQKITGEVLKMIAAAEDYLRELGFSQYRARTHGDLLRIEINLEEVDKLFEHRDQIIKKMKELGYIYVSLDLDGFRSGSMNEAMGIEK